MPTIPATILLLGIYTPPLPQPQYISWRKDQRCLKLSCHHCVVMEEAHWVPGGEFLYILGVESLNIHFELCRSGACRFLFQMNMFKSAWNKTADCHMNVILQQKHKTAHLIAENEILCDFWMLKANLF